MILLESIGNDQYKDHEYFFDSKLEFAHCVDYDNDGMFEIIGRDATNGTTDLATLFSLKLQGTTINETITPLGVYAKQTNSDGFRNYQVADVNNDGIMELSCYSKNGYTYMQLADSANERPSQPNSPTLLYEASTGILSITWEQGKDKETSSVDLTYALRIGTESGKGDIVYAHALPDGTRRNRMGGNQSSNRYRLLNTQTWAPGKYYIAVQCVDPNNRGSLFSKEVIFEKTVPACAFDLQYNSPFGVGDTCTIHLHRNVLLANQYDLQISNANIIDTLSNGRSIRIVFHQAGEQTITLTQKNQQGLTLVKEEKYIVVHPIPVINEIQALGNMMVAMDIDEDGKMEYYVDEYGFYAYDTQNNYAKINKMWNNHTYITAPAYADFHKDYVADINKDGKSDMFANYSSQWYRLINNGNKSMTIDDQLLTVPFDNTQLNKMIDFNNDGYLDIAYYKNQYGITYNFILKNEGDYYTFTQSTQDKGKACLFKDINKDGLVDYLQEVTLDGNGTNGMIAYQNNGDFTFSVSDTLVRYDKATVIYYMEDFDNDGILDWIYKNNGEFYIRWSNGEDTLLEGITGVTNLNLRYMNLYDDETNVIDLNNDGYLDIYATGGLNDHAGVLLFKSNHQYEFIEGIELHRSNGYTYLPFLMPDGYIRMGEKNVASNNTRPSAPTNITSSQTAKGVTITWLHSQDKETPAVRMKYNISIKKKGATGEGAYIISPYNSTKNGVHIPTTLHLIEGNQFFIPLASIPVGEYEVQVQGVDLHFLESDFSAIYNLTVSEIVGIEAPAATGVGIETQVTFAGNITPTIDWNGGQVITSNDNTYTITWDSEGIKHITAGEYSHSIYVHALPDATFTLPNEVMQFATVSIPAKNARDGKWNIAINGSDKYSLLSSYENVEILSLDMNTIVIRFLQEGTYNLRHCIDTDYGTSEYVQAVTVTTNPIAPTIRMVTQNNGVYQVLWQGGEVLPADVTAIRVYKESSYADIYTLLAELPLDSTSFTDWMSMPHVQSSRYALTYVTTYGESTKSTAHTGLHVMINKGMANTWNLSWAKYEGRKVAQYRIWRGNTAENLNLIGQVSGNMTSYSDIMTTDDVNYYAVEVIFEDEPSYRLAKRKNAIQPTSTLSNIVSTLSTNEVTFVEQILLQGEDIIAGKNLSSQLQAYVYPYYATYKLVNWVIMEGQEFASINNNGLLTLKNHYTNGTVLVRAYALDGSEVYSDIQIKVSGFKDTFKLIYKVDDEVWATKTYKVGESIILEAEPTKEGYTFTGWSEVPATMPAHDVEVNGFFTPSTSTSLDNVTDEDNNKAQKVIKDGVLYIILPDGTKYSAMGQKI